MDFIKRLFFKKVTASQSAVQKKPPMMLLLLIDRQPQFGPDIYKQQVAANLPNELRARIVEVIITPSYSDQYFIGTTAHASAIKNNFTADLEKLHYRSYSTADGVTGTMVFVYEAEQKQ